MNNNIFYEQALRYIESHDLNALAPGRHDIDGDNLFVNIVDASLKTASEARFEAHDRYIDIQIPLSGPESYGVMPRSMCTRPVGEFETQKDIIFFDDPIEDVVTAQAGEMVVFDTDTAHAPLIGSGPIHKAIFKVKA